MCIRDSNWAIGTEINLVKRLAHTYTDKNVFCLDDMICPCSTMYRVHPAYLLWVMEGLVAGYVINQIKVDDKIVNILVKEFPMINEISIEGNDSLDDEKLIDLISSKPLRVYNSTLAANDADKIANAYSSVGRIAAEVNPVIIRRSDNRVDLVFEVFEGKVVEIKRLSFVGNRNFSDSRLRRVLETKQAGLLRQFIKKDVFSEDRIELDKQLLADFYSSRGYIDFKLLSTTSALTRQRDGFFVTFKIDEGFSYSIGNLSIRSEIDGIDDQDYLPLLKLERGMVFSPTLVDAAMVRIEAIANDSGLNFVRVNPIIDRQDDTRTLDITFELVRGPRIFVERIDTVSYTHLTLPTKA